MTSQEVLNFAQARPFRPFEIRMNSGRTFDIRHSKTVCVRRHDVLIFTDVSGSPEVSIYPRNVTITATTVSLARIESLAPLDASVA